MRSFVALSALALAACAAETSSPPIPGRLEVVMGADQAGIPARSLDTLVVVRLIDDRGDPIAGASLRWTVIAGDGHVQGAGATTGPDGLATARWVMGNLTGAQQLQVGANGVDPLVVAAESRGMLALAVAVTDNATCAIDTLRVTRCWGNLDEFNFRPDFDYGPTPVVVDSTLRFTSIVGGASHVCALTATGAPWCWGYPNGGQLGTGNTPVGSTLPQQVAGGHSFTSISAAWQTNCALDAAGQAWCWGSPGDGFLGTGNMTEYAPAPVGQGSTVFTSISLGYEHICALDTNAEAWCWGHQDLGQLGDSSFNSQNYPVRVAGGKQYATISAGNHFTCATGLDHAVWCWGVPPITPYAEYQVPAAVGIGAVTALTGDDSYLVGIQSGRPVAAGYAAYVGIPPGIGGSTLTEMPGGLYSMERIALRWANICMIRSDRQLFCAGEVPGFGTAATPVGIPAP